MTLVGRPGRQFPRQREGWRALAECFGADTSAFFPDESRDHRAAYVEARAYCERCQVREPCLEEALAVGESYGLRGGLSPAERREERKAREWLAYREQRMAFA